MKIYLTIAKNYAFSTMQNMPFYIQDSDNDNAGYDKDKYFSYTWVNFFIIHHQYKGILSQQIS